MADCRAIMQLFPHGGCSCCSHHPIFCILPPHMLESIVQHGRTATQKNRALSMLGINNSLDKARIGFDESERANRQALRALRDSTQRPIVKAVLGGTKQRTIYSANNTQRLPGTVVRAEGSAATSDVAVFRIASQFKRRLRDWLEARSGLKADFIYPTPWHQPHLERFAASHGRLSSF